MAPNVSICLAVVTNSNGLRAAQTVIPLCEQPIRYAALANQRVT